MKKSEQKKFLSEQIRLSCDYIRRTKGTEQGKIWYYGAMNTIDFAEHTEIIDHDTAVYYIAKIQQAHKNETIKYYHA